ncbi:hypothetical protein IU486_30625 [Streptomyces gardneri]|nr:hypothetical protein [Streptomyces gardneri]MBF6208583.1 hypothetical protein [Streptomyces gardneri]
MFEDRGMSILFHNTMRITEGHLEQFEAAVQRAVAFVEEHGPQLMVQVFLDEERGVAHSFQLYRDSEAVLAHWKMSDPYIKDVMAHCEVQSFETYGEMSDEVLAGLRSGPAGEATVRPLLTGFTRF